MAQEKYDTDLKQIPIRQVCKYNMSQPRHQLYKFKALAAAQSLMTQCIENGEKIAALSLVCNVFLYKFLFRSKMTHFMV